MYMPSLIYFHTSSKITYDLILIVSLQFFFIVGNFDYPHVFYEPSKKNNSIGIIEQKKLIKDD